jgi:hypothetical protein
MGHYRLASRWSRYAEDLAREIELLLNRPDCCVIVWRENLCRATDGDPPDWDGGMWREASADVNDPVDAHFTAFAYVGTVQDRCSSSDEGFVINPASRQMTSRADENIVADLQIALTHATKYSGVHDHAVSAHAYGAGFSGNDGAEPD